MVQGISDRVSLTFTATAGTLASTVSGTVTNAQCENIDYATSYIPTTGTTVTRQETDISGGGSTADFNSPEGVLYANFAYLTNNAVSESFREFSLNDGTTNNKVTIYSANTNTYFIARIRIGTTNVATR